MKEILLTQEDAERLIDVLLTLESMEGTGDGDFDEDCKDAGELSDKIKSQINQ